MLFDSRLIWSVNDKPSGYGFCYYDREGRPQLHSGSIVWNVAGVATVPANTTHTLFLDGVLRYADAMYIAQGQQGAKATPPACLLNMEAEVPYATIQTFNAPATITVFVR
jgi:hypothetical protein